MADIYFDPAATGTDSGTSFANAFTDYASARTVVAPGDTLYTNIASPLSGGLGIFTEDDVTIVGDTGPDGVSWLTGLLSVQESDLTDEGAGVFSFALAADPARLTYGAALDDPTGTVTGADFTHAMLARYVDRVAAITPWSLADFRMPYGQMRKNTSTPTAPALGEWGYSGGRVYFHPPGSPTIATAAANVAHPEDGLNGVMFRGNNQTVEGLSGRFFLSTTNNNGYLVQFGQDALGGRSRRCRGYANGWHTQGQAETSYGDNVIEDGLAIGCVTSNPYVMFTGRLAAGDFDPASLASGYRRCTAVYAPPLDTAGVPMDGATGSSFYSHGGNGAQVGGVFNDDATVIDPVKLINERHGTTVAHGGFWSNAADTPIVTSSVEHGSVLGDVAAWRGMVNRSLWAVGDVKPGGDVLTLGGVWDASEAESAITTNFASGLFRVGALGMEIRINATGADGVFALLDAADRVWVENCSMEIPGVLVKTRFNEHNLISEPVFRVRNNVGLFTTDNAYPYFGAASQSGGLAAPDDWFAQEIDNQGGNIWIGATALANVGGSNSVNYVDVADWNLQLGSDDQAFDLTLDKDATPTITTAVFRDLVSGDLHPDLAGVIADGFVNPALTGETDPDGAPFAGVQGAYQDIAPPAFPTAYLSADRDELYLDAAETIAQASGQGHTDLVFSAGSATSVTFSGGRATVAVSGLAPGNTVDVPAGWAQDAAGYVNAAASLTVELDPTLPQVVDGYQAAIYHDDGAGGFTELAQALTITPPPLGEADDTPTRYLKADGQYATFRGGFADAGECAAAFLYTPDAYSAAAALFKQLKTWRVLFADDVAGGAHAGGVQFQGYLKAPSQPELDGQGRLTFQLAIKATGRPTILPPQSA